MARAVMECLHLLQQDVVQNRTVLQELIRAERFEMSSSENLLFLSRNQAVVQSTGTVRHSENRPPIEAFQKSILDDFGIQQTPSTVFSVDSGPSIISTHPIPAVFLSI